MDDIEDNGRRKVLKTGAALGVALAAPSLIFMRNAWAADFRNDPGKAKTVTLGFNVPQTGPYADEGADELRAFKLAAKHLNGEGDGGMMKTFKPSSLKGNGILGKKVDVRHRRHADQGRCRARLGQADDREGRRDHVLGRLVVGRRGRVPVARAGDGRASSWSASAIPTTRR